MSIKPATTPAPQQPTDLLQEIVDSQTLDIFTVSVKPAIIPAPQQPLDLPPEIVDSQFLDIFTAKVSEKQ